MLTRRAFTQCTICAAAGMFAPPSLAKREPMIFCATAIDPADANFYSIDRIDWQRFYLPDVPSLFSKCCEAMGVKQTARFSDDLPIQASWNSLNPDDPDNPRMYLGVGNLEAYPFSSLIAVILHELGHIFSYRSKHYPAIVAKSVKRQRELLADVMAGAAYAKMEDAGLSTREVVRGQCSIIRLPTDDDVATPSPDGADDPFLKNPGAELISLNPRRLLSSRQAEAKFEVLRENQKIETLPNYSMIGETPDEDPSGMTCFTIHDRSVDFVAMVAAVSSWRTFGDLPDAEESHGSPSERYQAFSNGYNGQREGNRSLDEILSLGLEHLGVRL